TEVRKRVLFTRLRRRFEEILTRACGDQFPVPAQAWEALLDGWAASGLGWPALEAALEVLPTPPPPVRGATKRRILVISGMFPSIAHGGGLRLFDIVGHLSAKNQVDLYSVYRDDLDAASLELLSAKLSAARLVRSD